MAEWELIRKLIFMVTRGSGLFDRYPFHPRFETIYIYIYIYIYIRRPQPSAGGARPRSTQRFSSGFVRLACIGMCRALAQAWLQRLCSALGPADASLLASESNVKQ